MEKTISDLKKIKSQVFESQKLQNPPPYYLEHPAKNVIEILNGISTNDSELKDWINWRIKNLKILISDLPGELQGDYDRKNMRYKSKFLKEYDKLKNIIDSIILKLK